MRTSLATVVALLAAGPTVAQSWTGRGSLRAYAMAAYTIDRKSGSFGQSIQAFALSNMPVCSAWAKASAHANGLKAAIRLSVGTAYFCSTSASASADLTLTLRAPVPTGGALIVTRPYVGAFVPAQITFAGKTKNLLFGSVRYEVSVDREGLEIDIRCTARTNFGSAAAIDLEFRPSPTVVTPFGSRCGIGLQGAWFPQASGDVYWFVASGMPSTPINFLIFGPQRLAIPLPPTNCMLLTSFPVVIPILATGGRHSALWDARKNPGFHFHAQVLGVERLTPSIRWRSSNALSFRRP